jgi:hypothetical protein
MKFLNSQLLIAMFYLAVVGADARATLETNASLADDIVSLVYDPRDGMVGLDLNRYPPGIGVQFAIDPSVGLFTGPIPDEFDCTSGLNQCSPGLFMSGGLVPTSTLLSFGPYAEPGLSANYIAANVSGFVNDGTGDVAISDLFYVPEPSGLNLTVAAVIASQLFRQRMRRL